jgi:SAM-dependent methyltransferase
MPEIKINLGSGDKKYQEFINFDISKEFHPDICGDVNALPIADSVISEVLAKHILEHIPDIIRGMNEIWRICKDGAIINIEVPHQSSPMAFADPTHKRIFNEESFKYFCSNGEHYWIHKSYGIYCDFTLISQNVEPDRSGHNIMGVKLRANKKGKNDGKKML